MKQSRTYNKREKEAIETLRFCFSILSWDHFQRCTNYKHSPVVLVNSLVKKNLRAMELIEIYQRFYGGNNE